MSMQNKDTWIQYKILAVGFSNILQIIYIGLGVFIQIVKIVQYLVFQILENQILNMIHDIKTDKNNINIIDTEKISVEEVP